MRALTPVECRVLGVLVEKQKTVPDTYPLSVNALMSGCNQKTSRLPVMDCTETQVLDALEGLRSLTLMTEVFGARARRYEHNMPRGLRIPEYAALLLAVLMLRGPQTSAELRLNAERLHRFADTSSVEGFLEELAARSEEAGGPLVQLLPRRPGEREARWMALIGDTGVTVDALGSGSDTTPRGGSRAEREALEQRVTLLEQELAELRAELNALRSALGG